MEGPAGSATNEVHAKAAKAWCERTETDAGAEIAARVASAYQSATGIDPVCFVTRPSGGPLVLMKP
jgi:hypothetical protein